MINVNRQPAGVPTGGQFAAGTRGRSGISLGEDSTSDSVAALDAPVRDLTPAKVIEVPLGKIRDDEGFMCTIKLDMSLAPMNPDAPDATKIDPETGKHPRVGEGMRFSVVASTRNSAGQLHDEVRKLIDDPDSKLARGFERADIEQLLDQWKSHHLNDTSAGCDHMHDFTPNGGAGGEDNWSQRPQCSETGENYGSTWYARQLPAETETWARKFIAKANDLKGV